MCLEIEHLSKSYAPGPRALDDVSLRIGPGLFGLLGPNGAGKTTLMRIVAALVQPDEGDVRLDGESALREPQELRRKLGYLPQDFGVYPGVSALELLDHIAALKGLTNRARRAEQVERVLRLANLYDVRRRAVSAYSGGMRQRFGIAQALLGSPRLVVVDEPTAGLDPEERNRFHDLLGQVAEGAIVLLSTHIVQDVRDLCPRMAVLAGGRVLLEGEPARLIDGLRGRVFRKTVPRAAAGDYRASYQVLSTQLFGGQTRVHVLAEAPPEPGFEPVEPDLEDVYFAALSSVSARPSGPRC